MTSTVHHSQCVQVASSAKLTWLDKYLRIAERSVNVSMLGAVLGHETVVLHHIQALLGSDHIKVNAVSSLQTAAVTLRFHRMKPRLPSDELASILRASAGFCSGRVAMLSIPGHISLARQLHRTQCNIACSHVASLGFPGVAVHAASSDMVTAVAETSCASWVMLRRCLNFIQTTAMQVDFHKLTGNCRVYRQARGCFHA